MLVRRQNSAEAQKNAPASMVAQDGSQQNWSLLLGGAALGVAAAAAAYTAALYLQQMSSMQAPRQRRRTR